MPYTVTLAPDHTAFTVEAGEPILAAAKRQNLNLPHSCQNGICGQCKAEVLSGQVQQGSHAELALSSEEMAEGKILMCCSTAQSDVALKVGGLQRCRCATGKNPARARGRHRISP